MFWRRKKSIEEKKEIEILPIEQLEIWVPSLVVKLGLEKGNFTILPCFGGILLFVKGEGISWIPYNEIRDALGKIPKAQLAENSALIGSIAVTGGAAVLPIFLVRGILKGTYRIFTKPPPPISLSFLNSLIGEIHIFEDTKISTRILEQFETAPMKDREKSNKIYKIFVYRKFLDKPGQAKSVTHKFLSNIKSFLVRSIEPEFTAPSDLNISLFIKILKENGIVVKFEEASNRENQETNLVKSDD